MTRLTRVELTIDELDKILFTIVNSEVEKIFVADKQNNEYIKLKLDEKGEYYVIRFANGIIALVPTNLILSGGE